MAVKFVKGAGVEDEGEPFPGREPVMVAALWADTIRALEFPTVDETGTAGTLDPKASGDLAASRGGDLWPAQPVEHGTARTPDGVATARLYRTPVHAANTCSAAPRRPVSPHVNVIMETP